MSNESKFKTMAVALAVCGIASVLVASAAVLLRPIQEANQANDRKKNILIAAGLIDQSTRPTKEEVNTLYDQVEVRVVELDSGRFVDDVDPAQVESGKLEKDPANSVALTDEQDLGKIQRRAKYQMVYLIRDGEKLDRIVLPIRGKGLWSTILGYLAVSGDANTVKGITFYSHGETAGLGAEIDNPKWKAKWVGKQLFDAETLAANEGASWPVIEVIKGAVDPSAPEEKAAHQVDGISGATLTGRGVMNLVRFWLGPDGFGPMMARLGEIDKTGSSTTSHLNQSGS